MNYVDAGSQMRRENRYQKLPITAQVFLVQVKKDSGWMTGSTIDCPM